MGGGANAAGEQHCYLFKKSILCCQESREHLRVPVKPSKGFKLRRRRKAASEGQVDLNAPMPVILAVTAHIPIESITHRIPSIVLGKGPLTKLNYPNLIYS